MNKNIKKIATVILATNVLASTVITTIPTGTHAAEEKLTSNLPATSSATLNYVTINDTQVSGHIPENTGKHLTVESISRITGAVVKTYTGVANEDGTYTVPINKMTFIQVVRVTFENGETVKQNVTIGDMEDFHLNALHTTDRILTGQFVGHPNTDVVITPTDFSNAFAGKTDAQGNFTIDLPYNYTVSSDSKLRVAFDDAHYVSYALLSEAELPSLPAVALNSSGLDETITPGSTGKMTTGVLPSSADQGVTYKTSDSSVITIDKNGNWRAMKSGSATITATSSTNQAVTHSIPVTVTSASNTASLDYVTSTDTKVTGHTPTNAGKHITVEAINIPNGKVVGTYTGVTDADGNYEIAVNKMSVYQRVRITFENGDTLTQQVTQGNMEDFHLDPIDKSKRVLTGSFAGHPNASIGVSPQGFTYPLSGKTDADGSFTIDLPSEYNHDDISGLGFNFDNTFYFYKFITETPLPILPAVAFDVANLNTASTVGDSGKMTTGVLPAAANQSVTYTSSDPSIMKVDADGKWTAVASGSATITVASSLTSVIATTIPVTVADPLKDASTAVDTLFADAPTNTILKDTTTQAMIDTAKAQVNALPASAEKTKLQDDIAKANTKFNEIAQTTIGALTTDSVKVTGKGEPNAPVTIKNGATTIGTGTVKADGTFEVTIAKQAANATITASVTKASNNKTATASTKVTQAMDYALTVNPYKMGDTKLTGTVGKNVSKFRLWINGAVAVQGVVNADGTYEFPTAASFIKLIGDKVEVVAVDSKFAEVNRTTVAVTGTSTFDNSLTVNKFNTGDTKISGTFGKDLTKIRLWVNGVAVTQATQNTNGTYEFQNASRFITSPLDKVEVVGVDAQYKELNRKTVSLPGSDSYNNSFSVDNYFIGQNTLGGSYGQNTSKVRLWVNGVVVKQADLNTADNTYTLKGIFGLIKSKTDVAEIVFVDAQYKEVKRIPVTIK